jgi:hypothetical protein
MNRLYQWLIDRASFFRSVRSSHGNGRTIRTEVTVERQSTAVLIGGAAVVGFDTCPLCGGKLAPAQAQPPSSRLLEGSIVQETGSVKEDESG